MKHMGMEHIDEYTPFDALFMAYDFDADDPWITQIRREPAGRLYFPMRFCLVGISLMVCHPEKQDSIISMGIKLDPNMEVR